MMNSRLQFEQLVLFVFCGLLLVRLVWCWMLCIGISGVSSSRSEGSEQGFSVGIMLVRWLIRFVVIVSSIVQVVFLFGFYSVWCFFGRVWWICWVRVWKKKMLKIVCYIGLICCFICGCWVFQCLYIQYMLYSFRVRRKSMFILFSEVMKKCVCFVLWVFIRGVFGVL